MKLYIKQHIFAFGDRFTVYDADGKECFFVQGEVFSFGKKLHLYNAYDEELALIHQKVFSFRPTYLIQCNDKDVAAVIREFSLFRQVYTVEGPGWHIEGNFFDHEYTIFNGDCRIATVSREWFTLGDAYEIDIADNCNSIIALAAVLIIDACLADDS